MQKQLFIFLLGLVLISSFILADNNCVPNMNTNEYYGIVYVNSDPLTSGDYILVAVIDGNIVGAQKIGLDGSYAIDVSPCPGVSSGEIEFFVGDSQAKVEIDEEEVDPEYDSSAPILVEANLILNQYPNSVCGNGEINKGEECDDENSENGDGCSNICEVELGYECEYSGVRSICTILEYCGDGFCNNGETCSSCSTDCGACQTGSSSGGSSGGGGGSSSGGSNPVGDVVVLGTNEETTIASQNSDLTGLENKEKTEQITEVKTNSNKYLILVFVGIGILLILGVIQVIRIKKGPPKNEK